MLTSRFGAAFGLVFVAFTSMPALAACPGSKLPVFACTTTKGKFVEVCDAGRIIQYSFGKKGAKPEMALSVPRTSASTYQWEGFGSTMTYTVRVPNGNTVYEVFDSVDRNAQEASSGIYVEVGGDLKATLFCKHATTISNIEGINLRSAN